MPRLRAISRFCLLLTLIAAACGGPPAASPTVPSPTPLAAATLTLSPVSSPMPSTTVPTATEEVTTNEQVPFPYLPADQLLHLSSVHMVDPQNGWAVFDSEDGLAHVLKTGDGGSTWLDVSPPVTLRYDDEVEGPSPFKVAASFLDADHAWVSLVNDAFPRIGSVWRTTDGGRHWEEGLLGRRTSGIDWIRFDPVDPSYGWAVVDAFLGAGSHAGEIFRTTDGGSTWETLLDKFGHASGIEFLNRQVGWVTTDAPGGYTPTWGLAITQDGGLTWRRTFPEDQPAPDDPTRDHSECGFEVLRVSSALSGVVDRRACTIQDDQGNLMIGSWLDFTADGGQTWQTARKPAGSPDFISAGVGWAVGSIDWNGGTPQASWPLYKTGDGGRTWRPVSQLSWQGDLDFVDERNGWGTDLEGTLRRTRDGGVTWEEVSPRSVAGVAPEDATVFLDLPAELTRIGLANAPRLQLLATLPANDPTSLVVHRNTLFVGNAHGQVLQWYLDSALHEEPEIWRVHSDWVYDLASVDDGGDLFTVSRDGSLRQWELFGPDGWWKDYRIHTGEVLSVALSPDLSMLATGGEDGTVKVQDLLGLSPPEPRLDLRGHQGWVWDVAFSRDGSMLASASGDATVKLWSTETGEPLGTLGGHTSTVSQVAFSPRGSQLASASWDGTSRIFDARTQVLLLVLEGHDDWVLGLAYAPEGSLLVSSGADGRVLLWDPFKGELIAQLVDLDVPVRGVGFDAQGRYLVAVTDDGRVLIWGVPAE